MSPESLPNFQSKSGRLRDRSAMLQTARRFFEQKKVLEVDCPILSPRAAIDTHIDLVHASYLGQQTCYLHSSPEYGMKRLLAEGLGDIYQLSHVFRDGELSPKHNPEFTMAEWYRLKFTLDEMIEETVQFIRLFLGQLDYHIVSYRDLFLLYTDIDYVTATEQDLINYLKKNEIPFYPSIAEEGKDALLNLILGIKIEPQLGLQNGLSVLTHYPASQAALARKLWRGDEQVAERFEIYYQGIELANGYHELIEPQEQRQRFHDANEARLNLGKTALPLDENFLQALEMGLPDCCGVAVGFDRLMMLRQGQHNISEVIAWGWELA